MLQIGGSSRDQRRNNDGQSIKILLKVAFLPLITSTGIIQEHDRIFGRIEVAQHAPRPNAIH
jgi:hypothetical protein